MQTLVRHSRLGRSIVIAVTSGALTLFFALGQSSDETPESDRNERLRERAEPLLDALKLSDTRRKKLMGAFENLHVEPEQRVWPEALNQRLGSADGAGKVRELLARHGFLPDELRWLDELPRDVSPDLRTSVIILHARQLLKGGPAQFENHWPDWNKGDTPGAESEATKEKPLKIRDLAQNAGKDISSLLASFVPKNVVYPLLQQRFLEMERDLEKLREEFIEIPPIEEGKIVKPGEPYDGTPVLTQRLIEEGYLDRAALTDSDEEKESDGPLFTKAISEAVKRFQEHHGRKADGILGPDTLTELNRGPDAKLEILRINLHRARLLPDEPGERYLIVNVPSTKVFAFSGSEEPVLTMKVIVGEAVRDRETPVFRDVMESVEFGPYWNVPVSIAGKEIVPKARNDHGYLARNNYEIVSRDRSSGAYSVNSGTLSGVESGDLLLRQKPGPKNALGSVKFLFPNDHAVYLHDTPKGELFAEAERDFSHGCIRVEKPADLAEYVLGPQGWDRGRSDKMLASGEREIVSVENPVNVYIVYFTAFPTWSEKDERQVRFHPDLYERDKALLRNKAEKEPEN